MAWELPSWLMLGTRYAAFGVIGLLLLGGVAMSIFTTGAKAKTTGKVVGIVGPMGSGKSYAAVRMALDRLQRGVNVYSNFHLDVDGLDCKGTWHPFLGWEQLADIRDAVVIVDEAHLYAPSHQHVNFPMLARWALAHGRKHGLDLYWISQHEDRVNKTLRALTNYVGVCESYFSGRFFLVTYYAPEDLRKAKKHMFRRFYRMDTKIADRYDTTATIEVDDYSLKGDSSAGALKRAQERHLAYERSRDLPQPQREAPRRVAASSPPTAPPALPPRR